MFHIDREKCLEEVEWLGGDSSGQTSSNDDPLLTKLYYLEGWQYEDAIGGVLGDFRENRLQIRDLHKWLHSEGWFGRPNPPQSLGREKGGFRLLICDRPEYTPPRMTMTREAFEQSEAAFRLSPSTLPAFCLKSGVCSVQRIFRGNKLARLNIVLKPSQKVTMANNLLSISYHITNRTTTAFLCGYSAVQDWEWGEKYGGPLLDNLRAMLGTYQEHWIHPLTLPVVLIRNHCERLEKITNEIEESLIRLESALGVTDAGTARPDRRMQWPVDVDVKAVTMDVQRITTNLSMAETGCEWARECIGSLLKQEHRIRKDVGSDPPLHEQLLETLLFDRSLVSAVIIFIQGLKIRTRAQADVLYSIASQKDNIEARKLNIEARKGNDMSVKIASAAKEDSIVMVTFTIITAVFLPGTFISSLFGISMFDWQYAPVNAATNAENQTLSEDNSGHGPGHVSKWFWIYWLVSIPLTTTILTLWYVCFDHSKKKWKKEVNSLMQKSE